MIVILDKITSKMRYENTTDMIITGFGILNEPDLDCDLNILKRFNKYGLNTVRSNLGEFTSVSMGDTFAATRWNDFRTDKRYNNTFLDTHIYHPSDPITRHLSPRHRIGLVW